MSAFYASAFGGSGTGSRSRRAQIAESHGKEPATRAAKTWGFKSASALKKWVKTSEWHHVGKYASAVDYYDVSAWIDDGFGYCFREILDAKDILEDLTKAGRETLLPQIVAWIVRENLDCGTKIRTPKSGKDRYARALELSARHGKIGNCYSTIGDLTEANWIAQMLAEGGSK